jgi:outer membrane protein TolC
VAYAEDEETETYTYEEALAMARHDLSAIATIDESYELMKEQLDDLKKLERDMRYNRIQPDPAHEAMVAAGLAQPLPTLDELRHTIRNLERQMESLELNRGVIYTGAEMSLRNALLNLANYELDARLLEATIVLNEENLRRVTLRQQYGLASDNDLRTAEQTLEQNLVNAETLSVTIASEKQSLNKILQLPLEAEILVEWERDFMELPEDLDDFIAEQTQTASPLKQKQLTADTKKANMDFNKKHTKDESKDLSLKSEYDQAVRELNDAKLSLEAAIRQNEHNIGQLEKRSASLELDAQKAADQFKTVQAHLNAVMVTQYELDQVSLSITNTEIAMEKNLNQLWLLQFVFAHPYLMT